MGRQGSKPVRTGAGIECEKLTYMSNDSNSLGFPCFLNMCTELRQFFDELGKRTVMYIGSIYITVR